MIFMTVIAGVLSLVQLIFGILPNAPQTPSSVTSAGSWVVTQISSVISVLNLIYGSTLLAAIMVVVHMGVDLSHNHVGGP
jgi:hypothetical protein